MAVTGSTELEDQFAPEDIVELSKRCGLAPLTFNGVSKTVSPPHPEDHVFLFFFQFFPIFFGFRSRTMAAGAAAMATAYFGGCGGGCGKKIECF